MRQFMRQEALSALGSRIVFSRRKHHVTPESESPRVYSGGRRGGSRPVVDSYVAKVTAEARFEEATARWIERCSAAKVAREIGSNRAPAHLVSRLTAYLWLFLVTRTEGRCV